ncbi:MAG: hypothetical protein ACLFV7_06945 [Phycisphaerae bacterium]
MGLVTALVLVLGVGVQALQRLDPGQRPQSASAEEAPPRQEEVHEVHEATIPHPEELPDPLQGRFDRLAGMERKARARMLLTCFYDGRAVQDWIDEFIEKGQPGVATFRRGGIRIEKGDRTAEYRVSVEMLVRIGPNDLLVFSEWIVDSYLGRAVPMGKVSQTVVAGDVRALRQIVLNALNSR